MTGLAVAAAAFVTSDQFSAFQIRQLENQIEELEDQRDELKRFAERLSGTRRVAQVNVVRQFPGDDGKPVTVLHWQQIAPSKVLGPREIVEVRGSQVYFEAMVVKFEHDEIGHAKEESNLAFFRRAFGNAQAPDSGPPLDQTAPFEGDGAEPDPQTERIWARFWELIEDPKLADLYKVRVAQMEAPSVRVKPGQVWEVSLDASGGLNLKKIGTTRLPPDEHGGTTQYSKRAG